MSNCVIIVDGPDFNAQIKSERGKDEIFRVNYRALKETLESENHDGHKAIYFANTRVLSPKEFEEFMSNSKTGNSMTSRVRGHCDSWDQDRGFGFIRFHSSGRDQTAFCHYSAISGNGFKKLTPGQEVAFALTTNNRGFAAIDVNVNPKSEMLFDSVDARRQNFFQSLRHMGWEVRSSANVALGIALEILSAAVKPSEVVIVTTNDDFIPLVEACRKVEINTVIAAFETGISPALRGAADEVYPLEDVRTDITNDDDNDYRDDDYSENAGMGMAAAPAAPAQ